MNQMVASGAESDEVVEVGTAVVAFPPGDVVGLKVGVGAAGCCAVPGLAGDDRVALFRCREPAGVSDVEDFGLRGVAFGAVDEDAGGLGGAGQIPEQILSDRTEAGQLCGLCALLASEGVQLGDDVQPWPQR